MAIPLFRYSCAWLMVTGLLEAPGLKAFTLLNRPSTFRLSRRRTVAFSSTNHPDNDVRDNGRRNLLLQTSTLWITTALPRRARASGLVQFPCNKPLGNTYHFMRVGETLLEEQDIWSTNPLFLTNREAALSAKGVAQVEAACRFLKDNRIEVTAGRYSLAASAMDSATIVIRELKLGRDRLIPEFTFMDPRAVGQWDMLNWRDTEAAVWAMDALEAGKSGTGARPPPNEDSTPNETLEDQAVRLRQLLSVLETQYSGDSILLIFPDGTGPALLSSLIAGIPLNQVHELEFESGEVRLNVTMPSTLALFQQKETDNAAYLERLDAGKEQLAKLRAMGEDVDLVDRKDEMYEQERLVMEQEQQEREKARSERQLAEEQQRDLRRRKIEEERVQRYGASNTENSPLVGVVGVTALAAIGVLAVGASSSAAPVADTEKADKENTVSPSTLMNGDDDTPKPQPGPPQGLGLSNALKQDGLAAALAEATSRRPLPPINLYGDDTVINGGDNADPYVVAKTAMEEYLDKDDGGNDWLQVLSEIIEDDDSASDDIADDAANSI